MSEHIMNMKKKLKYLAETDFYLWEGVHIPLCEVYAKLHFLVCKLIVESIT